MVNDVAFTAFSSDDKLFHAGPDLAGGRPVPSYYITRDI